MTTFDEREDAFERQFAHDEDLRFKAEARRNKLLGLWVADQLGLGGSEADVYAKEVVAADFEAPGHAGLLRKVLGDLSAKHIALTENDIRAKMNELLATALAQVKG